MNSSRKAISVAMATYNGQNYIRQQIDSILLNLNEYDELIISDDGSKDNTLTIVLEKMAQDSRIKLYYNTNNHGVIHNFENALKYCSKDIIFLSDQDDTWRSNKVSKILESFNDNNKVLLVLHNANIYNELKKENEVEDMYTKLGYSNSVLKNIIKNRFIGCCMAFKKELLNYALPFPSEKSIHIHDWWIAIVAMKVGETAYVKDRLITYRIHSNNTLGFNKTACWFKLRKRCGMILFLTFKFRRRIKDANLKKNNI